MAGVEIREARGFDDEEELPQERPPRPGIQLQLDEITEKDLVEIVRSDYEAAKNARQAKDYGLSAKGEKLDFDLWYKKLKDLYNARREPKTTPWKFASNRSLRIATAILDTLHARLVPTVINEDLLRWHPGEVKDVPKVERIQKLMNWWIWVRSSQQDFFDIWVKMVAGFGDCLTETTWQVDVVDKGETTEQAIVNEEGIPQFEQDGSPAMAPFRDVEFYEKTCSRTYMKDQVYLQDGARDLQKEPVIIEETVLFRELQQGEAEGKFVNVENGLKQKIPFEDKSGSSADPERKERLKDIKLRNVPVKVQRWYGNFDADGDGFPEDVRVTICLDHNIYLGGVAVKNLTKSGKRPIDFTKFDNRLDRPEEADGEGVLEKVRELAEEIDAIFNQLTDANTLSILRPGFYDPSGDLDAPILKLSPNKMTPVSDPARNVFFPDISIQITQLLEAIRLVLEFVERLTAASAFVFGKEGEFAGGSGTATRTNAILQSAETRFARPAERLRAGAAKIIKQHLDILQLNIPEGLETRLLGEKGEPVFKKNELTAAGISGEFDAYLLPDPSMGSKQIDRDLSGMFYSLLMQNPIVATDPAKIYKVTANVLKAWDKDPEEFLGPAPQADDIDDPKDENTLIVQGDFARVRAQITENHLLHIQEHIALLQSPSLMKLQEMGANALVEQIQMFVSQHIQEHQQMMQLMMAVSQQLAGGKGAGAAIGGTAGGNTETNEGAPNASGVEQAPGPLGNALDAKRKGESGPPTKTGTQ